MKPLIVYIEAQENTNKEFKLSLKEIKKLPKKLLLLYSIQYKPLALKIKSQLKANNIKIQKFQQVLGCSKISNQKNLPIFLISTGRFHAQNLYSQAPIIYILENNKITKISLSQIQKLKIQRKTSLIKFLNADKIGILVSIKPGQENLKQAIKLKQFLLKKQKQSYIFLANSIDVSQFENFNIDSWVNTACPGLSYDNSEIVNIDELLVFDKLNKL